MSVILGFEDETTGTVVSGRCPKGFPADPFKVARRRLGYLDADPSRSVGLAARQSIGGPER